jgi:membrane protein YqaA with SNARE-associated domain
MKKPHISNWLRRILTFSAGHRYYTVVVALIAFVSTATFAFPFVIVLIPAVLIAPRRWLLLGLLSGMASGVGAAVLVELFNHLGRELVISRFPELVQSESWQLCSNWLQMYGLFALMLIAGSPIPQTPALLFYSLVSPSILGVLVAVGVGKTVKYVFLAWATYRYPARLFEYR